MRLNSLAGVRSIRVRIALLSVLVSGTALAVFMGLTLAAVQRSNLERLDSDILEFGHKHLIGPVGPRHWEGLDQAMRYFLGSDEDNAFILLVKRRDNAVLHRSENWPSDLSVDRFTPSEKWERADPSKPLPSTASPKVPAGRQGERERPVAPDIRANDDRTPPGRAAPMFPLRQPVFSTCLVDGIQWRIGVMGNPETTLVIGLNLKRLSDETAQVRHAFLIVLPVALLLVGVGAWWISQRSLKSVQAVTKAIRLVKAKGLDQRISPQYEDKEFSELIDLFNDMMDWLERGFRQAVRFSADASHELKTPLTVLQAQLERAVCEARPGSGEQRRYVALGKELQRLKSITEKLLLLSRIDAGELKLVLWPLNFSELVEGAVEDTETLAPQLDVEGEIETNIWVMADPDLLKQVIQNLSANAVKFNCDGGYVRFQLSVRNGKVRLLTENSGPGIPPDDKDKLFTRFYRADRSRERGEGGAGLGLSIAREIARAHKGDLVLRDGVGGSTVFELTLPRMVGEAKLSAGSEPAR